MQTLRKVVVISVMFVTVLSMSVVVAPSAKAAASAGDLIKMSGLSSVYYLGADGKRYVFPNEATYFSWYGDFSSVVTIPQSELESYPLGANVTIRPGNKLVKITTDPKVYAVEPNGSLVHVTTEAAAKTLWGDNWAKRVVDVPDAFFTNYKVSTKSLDGTAYPTGSLIKSASAADIYYIDSTGKARKIANEAAFTANRFSWGDVITATLAIPTIAAEISGAESALTDTSSGAGGTAGAGSGLTVALASDTPASATVITNLTANGQANVPFTKVNFTASSDGDVKVTNLKYKRAGISSDTDLDALYLYDGATRLTDSATISSNVVTFNNASGLFTVPAGTTKGITLKGDMYYLASSGKTISFSVESSASVTTNGAAVSGSFPATGNPMSTANATDLGQLAFSSYTTIPGAANTAIDADTTDQEVWRFTLASTNQALSVEKIVLTEIGSVQSGDLANFKLYYAGTVIAETAAFNSNFEVVFDMSSAPFSIPKGSSRVISVRADIIKGSTRTFYFTIQNSADVTVKDTQYNVYVEPYLTGTWAVIAPTSTYNYQISSGTLSIAKSSDSPTGNIVVDGTNVLLGRFDFRASGEDIKIKNIDVQATASTYGGIDNGKVYLDGVQVGTTKDLTQATDVNFTFGSTFVVPAGQTSKVEIYGDVKTTTSTSFSGGETVYVDIAASSGNAQRMASLGTFDAPSSDVPANTLNITAAGMSVSTYSGYGNQTLVAGSTNVRLGSFVLAAGSAEGVDAASVTVVLSTPEAATVTNLYLKDNVSGTQLGQTKVSPSTSNIFSVNFSIPASGSKIIDLYGDIKSGSNAGPWIANVAASGSGKVTGNAVSASAADIQTITVGTGAIYVNAGSQPSAAILVAGSANNSVAQFTFSAANDSFTISELNLKTQNNFATTTAAVKIKYGSSEASSVFLSNAAQSFSTATFTGLNIVVPKDGSINVDVELSTVLLASSGASGANGAIYLDWNNGFKATGSSGAAVTTVGSADLNGNLFYVRKSKPTFAKQTVSTAPNYGTLYKFTVAADAAGNIELKQLGFTVTTVGTTVTQLYLYDPSSSTQLTDTKVDTTAGAAKLIVGAVDDDVLVIGTTAKTYEVRGTVTGWGDTGDSVIVSFTEDTAVSATASSETLRGAQNNVWSDKSVTNHSTTSADWTNGYLLKNMSEAQSF